MDCDVRLETVPEVWQIATVAAATEQACRRVCDLLKGDFALILALGIEAAAVARMNRFLTETFGRVCEVLGATVFQMLQVAGRTNAAVTVVAFERTWLRVGIGVASPELGPIAASMRAVTDALAALGRPADQLDARHAAFTLFDSASGREEAFCLGTTLVTRALPLVGGALATIDEARERAGRNGQVWRNGELQTTLGVVVVCESARRITTVSSIHVEPTPLRTVVTSCVGKYIDQLDGKPAAHRLAELLETQGTTEAAQPRKPDLFRYPLGWYANGRALLRSIIEIEGERLVIAGTVTKGQVLRVMQPVDIVATTRRDLEAASVRVGGTVAWLAFSCTERELETRGLQRVDALAKEYGHASCVGFESLGEQAGAMLVNHTLTALAIGAKL